MRLIAIGAVVLLLLIWWLTMRFLLGRLTDRITLLRIKVADLETEASTLRTELNSKTELLQNTTIRLEANMSANRAFETSRDQVWDMYRRASLAGGNAQAWLFRELNSTIQQLNAYRAKDNQPPVEPPVGLGDLLEQYRADHLGEKDKP